MTPLTYSELANRLSALAPAPHETDRDAMRAACIQALSEQEFTADDLRMLFVLITALTCIQPAALFAQLRKAAAAGPV